MITRKDVWISIILGIGSLMVSIGVIGVKKIFCVHIVFHNTVYSDIDSVCCVQTKKPRTSSW